MSVEVTNHGEEALPGVVVTFFQGRKALGENVLTVAAGATVRTEISVPVAGEGRVVVEAVVDPKNLVAESNERNNRTRGLVTVAPPGERGGARGGAPLQSRGFAPLVAVPVSAESSAPALDRVMKRMPANAKVPYGAPAFQVVEPQQGETWLKGKTYDVKWLLAGSSAVVEKMSLRNALKPNLVELEVSVNSGPNTGKVTSAPLTIPAKQLDGDYFIRVEAAETVNGKKTIYTADSAVFIVSWAIKGVIAGKAVEPDLSNLIDHARDIPTITFFDYSKTINGCSGLNVEFYWKDEAQNLRDGTWTLEWQDANGWMKKSGKISELPNPDDFLAAQGLCKVPIQLCERQGAATPIRFFLKDEKGIVGNTVTGIVNAGRGPQVIPPAGLAEPIVFVSPPPVTSPDAQLYLIRLKKGDSIDIRLRLDVPPTIKSAPVTIEIFHKGAGSALQKISEIIPNNGATQVIPWKVPLSAAAGGYYFKAVSTTLNATATSAVVYVSDQSITGISPTAGSAYTVNDTVPISWSYWGIPDTDVIDVYFKGENVSGWKPLELNPTPLPVKNAALSWKILPGTVPAGKGRITFGYKGNFLGYSPVFSVNYPQNDPPSLVFRTPKPWQTTKWLAGTSELVEWETYGQFPASLPVDFFLKPIGGVAAENKIVMVGNTTIVSGKRYHPVSIPADLASGPYRVVARSATLGPLGESSVIELVGSDMTVFEGPAPNTVFEITNVDYPAAGGTLIVHVRVDSPKPFRFGVVENPSLGSQSVTCQLENFQYGANPQPAAFAMVSVKNNTALFPKYVFPAGISTYMVSFTPKLTQPLSALKTSQDMPELGAGEVCFSNYYPKLKVRLQTTLTGNQTVSADFETLLMKVSGLQERFLALPGQTNLCRSDRPW